MKRSVSNVVFLLVIACTTDPSGDETTASETAASETAASETETGDDPMDGHGTIRIEINPLAGDTTMFEGTTEVVATVHYETCLQDFYLLTNSTFQQAGPDGAPIFAAWPARLCMDFEGSPTCSVVQIEQSLLEANAVYLLQVVFAIDDPSTLPYSQLFIGPLPTSELAGCPAEVELQASGLFGRNDLGVQLWRISTLPADNTAETNQGAPLRVEVIPTQPP